MPAYLRCQPATPAAWTLDDPRRCTYFVFWTCRDGSICLSLRMESIDDGQAVQISTRIGDRFPIKILRQPLPAKGAASIMYRCPWCGRPRRYLYPLTLAARKLVGYQGPRCRECAGLRWASQGTYQSVAARAFSAALRQPVEIRSPMPREPWDPRAAPACSPSRFPRSCSRKLAVLQPGNPTGTPVQGRRERLLLVV